MEQIEIKILHNAFFQLLFKNLFHLIHIGKVIARELCSQEIAVPGIGRQYFPHGRFRISVMVSPGRIIIIDAMLHGIGYHPGRFGFVNLCIISVNYR